MATEPRPRPAARCPVCGRAASAESRPFCSPRCAQADLGRWLTGAYAIPGAPEDATGPDDESD
ncbi:DNA gyrase inhibitor YacG [Roseomonas eburnea]|uniref:DNA gyrase inhibitor YacG n=1 Tax=Neoroseomonas eburnea TaxID=1346889 RepID=A0A9X9XHN6_9PROT|nr:DNA gyrase inhibitor YacG [Neoroseomonas eburnea]MBR0683222.1 DNA gyrase inhibitor YacG [Neoroseomonas eburnea]